MKVEKTQKELPSRAIQTKLNIGRMYMKDNRLDSIRQAKMIDSVQKLNESMNRVCQQKRDLSRQVADRTLAEKWQPARERATMYLDGAVSDWIDCAIKLGIPAMKPTDFGHASGKKRDGSRKANSAYDRLRTTCRTVARVADDYKVSQLYKDSK